jgi:BolA protein
MSKAEKIRSKLAEALTPTSLEVFDDSESHRGHAGYQDGGESHFHVVIRSHAFEGQTRIARHRAVHAALGKELVASIHALSMDLGVPE